MGRAIPDLLLKLLKLLQFRRVDGGTCGKPGALHCVPHGDGNQRTFITVPCGHSSLPSGSYFVPSTLPSTVQRALFGQLSRRRDCLLIAWVQPRPLAGYLAALGHASVSSMLMGAHAQTMVPLLTRQALRELGREDLWPADWPPPPPALATWNSKCPHGRTTAAARPGEFPSDSWAHSCMSPVHICIKHAPMRAGP